MHVNDKNLVLYTFKTDRYLTLSVETLLVGSHKASAHTYSKYGHLRV